MPVLPPTMFVPAPRPAIPGGDKGDGAGEKTEPPVMYPGEPIQVPSFNDVQGARLPSNPPLVNSSAETGAATINRIPNPITVFISAPPPIVTCKCHDGRHGGRPEA